MEEENIRLLTVLGGILNDEAVSAFADACEKGDDASFCKLVAAAMAAGAESNFIDFVCKKILEDENAFSIKCASDKSISPYLKRAYVRDLKIIFGCLQKFENRAPELLCTGKAAAPFEGTFEEQCEALENFYKKYGYGMFIDNRAFGYENGRLVPVSNPSSVTLDDLKCYEQEKATINSNIVNFMSGLPFGNMLLYGDRGTGKSSTIHAMLNRYWEDGLRLIELNKENMLDLPKIRQLIIENPLKFIIFIDDLSLNENDDKISGLKAALEGSVAGNTANTMIVATSNRRHIVKENFSDRDNSVHVNDSLQEQLSLSDRFGITVLFSSTGKTQYLDIVKSLAADESLECDDGLLALAERWALTKGGRSPRRARQFIDIAVSCKKRGVEIDF